MDEQMCPLLAASHNVHKDIESPTFLCRREKCAWWVAKRYSPSPVECPTRGRDVAVNECAIFLLAKLAK